MVLACHVAWPICKVEGDAETEVFEESALCQKDNSVISDFEPLVLFVEKYRLISCTVRTPPRIFNDFAIIA